MLITISGSITFALCIGSSVRDIVWLDLTIGVGAVAPDPPMIFDAFALLVYESLQREDAFSVYNGRTKFYQLPAAPLDLTPTAMYRKFGPTFNVVEQVVISCFQIG